ncbi:TPA: exo-alpha-sialidase [Klebsiella pneumoniae]|uniref:sialidase family protein n=1 Tax=Klebsiella pneumoniae TaxID=573 RepID=UPI00199C69AD|nr:sialidase family protein [Klebsiella pneumoniae]EIX9322209.1 exo-alpha-sialidase [Klebsiella pneumoniae]ELC0800429.1 exo-alpha-sialidase [Klebsiella pneumoniae]MBD7492935.1 exo-alpha-sialidase [Klebsiella pneumoniae]MBR8629622.1 exo-alpha-sialidase [Klebsiella pneumoniae subsp. pneumoniae]HBZ1358836.1 exo-alpha-sialidase [Klebsiella pneumoniae]
MADFDPALGSSSPAVLLDNATRLDKLVNGTEEEVSDRGGEPLPTWRNMVVKIDAQVSQLESIIGGLDGDLPILDSVESGLAATSEGQYFRVPGGAEETTSFYIYKNVSGVADLVARQLGYAEINEIKELVFYKTSPLISYNEDYSGNRFAAYSPDGGFFLPGMIGALQDQYAIKNAGKIKVGMAKAETISEVVGTDETIFLSRQNDDTGSGYVVFSPDGGMYLLGMIGALQDQYAIKNAADIKAGIAGINAVQASVEAMRPTLIDRLFYAQNKAGELVSQAVRIGRVTRRQKTGYNLNSWPQGKLCIDSNGRIYCGYNSAPSHGGAGTVPVLTCSDDDGVSWSDPVQIVTGENYARGTDWWSLGVDSDNHLWGIVRSRGATNLVGVTFYNLYKSTDGGASWVKVGEISSVTQTISDVEYVPELFHDMCYIPTTGRMVTGYHFANSSRVGFMSFDISDPLNTIITQDVIAHGEFSTTVYCEPTIAVEYTRNAEGTIYGGLRTQTTGNPSQLYFMNTDLTGFTRFNAPESVQYSPMTIRRINGQFILLTVERYNTGAMNLWFGTPADFYSMAASNFWKMPIGKIVDETTTGASNVGVQDMEIYGDHLYFAWSNETQNTYADTYIGKMNIVNPASLLNNDYLEGL